MERCSTPRWGLQAPGPVFAGIRKTWVGIRLLPVEADSPAGVRGRREMIDPVAEGSAFQSTPPVRGRLWRLRTPGREVLFQSTPP